MAPTVMACTHHVAPVRAIGPVVNGAIIELYRVPVSGSQLCVKYVALVVKYVVLVVKYVVLVVKYVALVVKYVALVVKYVSLVVKYVSLVVKSLNCTRCWC